MLKKFHPGDTVRTPFGSTGTLLAIDGESHTVLICGELFTFPERSLERAPTEREKLMEREIEELKSEVSGLNVELDAVI